MMMGVAAEAKVAIERFESGDLDGAGQAATAALAKASGSKVFPSTTRFFARAVLTELDVPVPAEDANAALEADLRALLPTRPWQITATELGLARRLFDAGLLQGAVLVYRDLLPRLDDRRNIPWIFLKTKKKWFDIRLGAEARFARCLNTAGQIGERLEIEERVFSGYQAAFGANHLYAAQAACNLGRTMYEAGRFEEAFQLLTRASDVPGYLVSLQRKWPKEEVDLGFYRG
jgi:tetratricopeptide (TPR) repeat protein